MSSNNSLQPEWSRKARFLTQALIVSGALNIGLLATFVYSVFQKKEAAISFERPPAGESPLISSLSNERILFNYSTLSFPELVELLDNHEKVEDGYQKRDLALASLAAFHFFNLEKALGSLPSQRRFVSFIHQEGQEKIDIPIFPGLSDADFQAAIQYAKTERWPVTTGGLFFELKQGKNPTDPSLLEAFYLSPEFHSAASLFLRCGLSLPKETLVGLLSQGDWGTLQQLHEEQKLSQDLSPARLKTVLLRYLHKRSLLAAKIFVEWDRESVMRRFEDADLFLLLDVHTERTEAFETLLKELLLSPRGDAVQKKAAEKLYAFEGLALPEPYNSVAAFQRFCPQNPAPKAEPQGKKIYIVQEGDSLWKIARKHKVSIEQLQKLNKLETDKLRPGRKLEIPLFKEPDRGHQGSGDGT